MIRTFFRPRRYYLTSKCWYIWYECCLFLWGFRFFSFFFLLYFHLFSFHPSRFLRYFLSFLSHLVYFDLHFGSFTVIDVSTFNVHARYNCVLKTFTVSITEIKISPQIHDLEVHLTHFLWLQLIFKNLYILLLLLPFRK